MCHDCNKQTLKHGDVLLNISPFANLEDKQKKHIFHVCLTSLSDVLIHPQNNEKQYY